MFSKTDRVEQHWSIVVDLLFAIYLGYPRASDVAPSDLYCGDGSAPPLVIPRERGGGIGGEGNTAS